MNLFQIIVPDSFLVILRMKLGIFSLTDIIFFRATQTATITTSPAKISPTLGQWYYTNTGFLHSIRMFAYFAALKWGIFYIFVAYESTIGISFNIVGKIRLRLTFGFFFRRWTWPRHRVRTWFWGISSLRSCSLFLFNVISLHQLLLSMKLYIIHSVMKESDNLLLLIRGILLGFILECHIYIQY